MWLGGWLAGGAGFGCLWSIGSSNLQNPNCQTPKAAEQLGPPKTGNSRGLQVVVLFLEVNIGKIVFDC